MFNIKGFSSVFKNFFKAFIKVLMITFYIILSNGQQGTNNITVTLTNIPGLVFEKELNIVGGFSVIVYTDYDNITARYGCTIVNGQKQEYFYIMTRSRGYNDYNKLFLVMDTLKAIPGVDLTKLQFDLKNDLTCLN